ncbi:MAG: ribulose-phosphate 3-epimerase [Ignavibacteriae bacterium HGW-Ignavibacteriae-2]|jgi:ribulose-phosphate 3-epimerase|nr:ribulose-phosphate 3-epimerase [Bacteroidota bacterium]PKL87509.1 MAG: ribulose-phosphate 3-epimerase [Ignavibacteriae bacterium HGW-Ignavibacteriae-2]
MKLLAPSILSADFSHLSQQIRLTEMGGADIIHCDIMDGSFVPNISFGPIVVEAVKRVTKLPLDVHLMIKNPEKFIEPFAKAGANYISVHQEEVTHLNRTIMMIKDFDVKAGVVLNPSTPVSTLTEILEFVDYVLIMSVNPGFGGQKFIASTLNKIRQLNHIRSEKKLDFKIEIDGGVDKSNIQIISEAGCDIFVAGSSVFNKDNVTAATIELKNLL